MKINIFITKFTPLWPAWVLWGDKSWHWVANLNTQVGEMWCFILDALNLSQEIAVIIKSLLAAFLFYTLLLADNFKMAATCELHCMLLALKFGKLDNRCMKIFEINCTVHGMIVWIKCVMCCTHQRCCFLDICHQSINTSASSHTCYITSPRWQDSLITRSVDV